VLLPWRSMDQLRQQLNEKSEGSQILTIDCRARQA
jgi:hypothetical protein